MSEVSIDKMGHKEAAEIFSVSNVAFVLTDPQQKDNPIIYVNRAFERLTGYSSSMAVGHNCRFLQGETTDPADVKAIRKAIDNLEDVSLIIKNFRSNGDAFYNALLISPVFADENEPDSKPRYFIGIQREIGTDREKDQLKEFEEAIAEVQHRVKNHLAMILSLIRLKTREMDDAEDLGDISRRIESLQLLYEEMSAAQRFKNDDKIQLGAYLGRVANAIAHIDGRPGVRVNIDVSNAEVQTDTAARIGLIVSEILTNCMQHAFKGQETGLVEVRAVHTDNGGLRVTISDDGVGIPEGVNWPHGGGLGSRIVLGLVKGLNGTINVTRGKLGTIIVFGVENVSE